MLYVNKGGCSSNCKIVPAEFLHLVAKYTLPFSKLVKSDHNKIFDMVGIITKKQKKFSVRSSPDPQILKKIAVRSSPHPAKIGFSPGPVRSCPDPCSSLVPGLGLARVGLL